MINLEVFEHVRQKYSDKDLPFLSRQRKQMHRDKKYKGLKIIQNIPLTIEAVLKIEPFLLSEADITVSCLSLLTPQPAAIEILKAANIKMDLLQNGQDIYDVVLDCCGEFIKKQAPRLGTAELTQTGSIIYQQTTTSYPVLSIDDSNLKFLETLFGTGDGFIRALQQTTKKEIYDKKFIIFGYGKVGKGIVQALIKFTDNIIVIDKKEEAKKSSKIKGLKYLDSTDIISIKKEIKDAQFVVTATGIKNVISEYYNLEKKDFNAAFLCNMGAEDEYGGNFTDQDISFNKNPLNFCLAEPTTMKYLDPVFYAHNLSVDLFLSSTFKPGYNPFPNHLADNILKEWADIHGYNSFSLDSYLL